MTREEAKSCISTIEMLQRLAYNIHGVMDLIDADNCKKIIKALEQKSVLDKIREEIKKIPTAPIATAYTVKSEALKIIDKHKAESEE